MLVVSELFNIVVNDVDAKKSIPCSQVLIVTELVVSRTDCNSYVLNVYVALGMSLALGQWPVITWFDPRAT